MRKLKLVAVTVVFLVIMLPVVAAQQLSILSIAGADNINGVAKSDDTVTINAQVSGMPSVTSQNVRLDVEGVQTPFTSCSQNADGTFNCVHTDTFTGAFGSSDVTVKLFDDNGIQLASDTKSLAIDTQAPELVIFQVAEQATSNGNFTVRFRADDYATAVGDISSCSGIAKIEFFDDGTKFFEVPGDGTCSFENVVQVSISSATERSLTLSARAVDRFGLESGFATAPVSIDNSAPQVTSLAITTTDGLLISHVRTGVPVTADVSATITDINLNTETVQADFTALNPQVGPRPFDERIGDIFIWHSIPITNPQSCSVVVAADDIIGNHAQQTLQCTIGIDNTPPTVSAVVSERMRDNKVVLPASGVVVARFDEKDDAGSAGSGFDAGNAFLDASQLGLSSQLKAEGCGDEGSGVWNCSWDVQPAVASGGYRAKIASSTADDLGNSLAADFDFDVEFDNTPPSGLTQPGIRVIPGEGEPHGNFLVQGDTVEITASATDVESAFANFTAIGGSYEAGACTGDAVKNCTFTGVVSRSGPADVTVSLDFFDFAGNKASSTLSFKILGVLNETSPNHWDVVKVDCSPSLVDRQTAQLINTKVFCRAVLSSPSGNAETADIQRGDLQACVGDTNFLADLGVVNTQAGSREPIFELTLATAEFGINSLNISCPLSITTKIGDFVTTFPEQETVNLSIKFYNQPLGLASKALDKEIKSEVSKAKNNLKFIAMLKKFFEFAEKICRLKSVLTSIISTITVIHTLIMGTAEGLQESVIFAPLGIKVEVAQKSLCGTAAAVNIAHEGIFHYLDLMCSFVNCQLAEVAGGTLGVVSVLGGGWCGAIQDKVMQFGAGVIGMKGEELRQVTANSLQPTASQQGFGQFMQPINVKESLIWSTICLCVPGIIHNLNKYRQIQCQYAYCLANDVKERGLPVSFCKKVKSYASCNFVYGEIFNAIPFTALYNYFVNIIIQAFANPFVALGLVSNLACNAICAGKLFPGSTVAYKACSVVKVLAKIGDAVGSIKNLGQMRSMFGRKQEDWCDKLKSVNLDAGSEEAPTEGGGGA